MQKADRHLQEKEAQRLFGLLEKFEYTLEDCERFAPTTLEINQLKKEKNAIILAHTYQTPDIQFGVADHLGDSYGLSKLAAEADAEIILFSSVYFMGETAKILNPQKTVLVPSRAGCSLADAITADDVQKLREEYPDAGFVAYVNTTAEVKAAVDVCCTSSNALHIVESMPQQQIVFLPDKLMGENLQKKTNKDLILWDGVCVVHEQFSQGQLDEVRREYPDADILVHPECDSGIVQGADFVGSTEQILEEVRSSSKNQFMVVSECGLSDRIRQEVPQKNVVGACHLCPYMKQLTLNNILQALRDPQPHQIVEIDTDMIEAAAKSLQRMFEMSQGDVLKINWLS